MSYRHELLGFDGDLELFFAEHLGTAVLEVFKGSRILGERTFGAEFDYICYILAIYVQVPLHISQVSDFVIRYHNAQLDPQEKIIAAETTLLTCGFFRRQSQTRGRCTYPLKYYGAVAQQIYREIRELLGGMTYGRIADHFPQWTSTLDQLASNFERDTLEPFLIRVKDEIGDSQK